jgi:predicted acetyltransferase
MNYRLPEISDQAVLQAYVLEHFEQGENSISASMGLLASAYPDWVEKIQTNASVGDALWGRSLMYLCFEQDRLVGLLSIRYELPAELTQQYGDIGYGVRPSERQKGYATTMLRYALSVCKEKGMDRAILGCYQDNPASAAVIRKNGGVLIQEKANDTGDRISQYYSVDLSAGGA